MVLLNFARLGLNFPNTSLLTIVGALPIEGTVLLGGALAESLADDELLVPAGGEMTGLFVESCWFVMGLMVVGLGLLLFWYGFKAGIL